MKFVKSMESGLASFRIKFNRFHKVTCTRVKNRACLKFLVRPSGLDRYRARNFPSPESKALHFSQKILNFFKAPHSETTLSKEIQIFTKIMKTKVFKVDV